MNLHRKLCYSLLCLLPAVGYALPKGFVYLSDIDPSIIQDMRYAGPHNFIGRTIEGYLRGTCILTKKAALRLKAIQKQLKPKGYSLKVYDCYRPQQAVNDFYRWSQNKNSTMKAEFYPREDKKELFRKGYIANYSGHSRGSTVDLTLVPLNKRTQESFSTASKLRACYAPYKKRFKDNSINMGTGYDCLDKTAHVFYKQIPRTAKFNRYQLRKIMLSNGFYPYNKEWWHYTLRNEPFKRTYFNFPVR